jgi:hypothetical protein
VPLEQPIGRQLIGRSRPVAIALGLVQSCRIDGLASLLEDKVNRGSVHTLEPKLLTDGPLPTWSRSVARLDPSPSEGLVVEHPDLGHALDRPFDQIRAIPGAGQAPTNFGHGSRSRLEEPSRRLEHNCWVVNGPSALAALSRGLARPACQSIPGALADKLARKLQRRSAQPRTFVVGRTTAGPNHFMSSS